MRLSRQAFAGGSGDFYRNHFPISILKFAALSFSTPLIRPTAAQQVGNFSARADPANQRVAE
jgi:hypothetical protein